MKRVVTGLGLSLLSLAVASGAAHGQATGVITLNGGYSERCEQVARGIGKSITIELTGTRLNISPLELCTLAIREDASGPSRAANHNNRGVLLFAEGRLEEALQDFQQAIQLRETLANAHANRGYTLVALGQWAEAVTALNRGIELGAEEAAKAHFSRAIAHEELGQLREAYQDYTSAAELDPQWDAPIQELSRFQVGGN